MIISNPIPTRWVTHRLENKNAKAIGNKIANAISHCCEDSEPLVRLSSLVIQQRDWESPGSLAGFDYRTPKGLRETETPVLEGTNKILCTPRPRGEEQRPCRRLNQNYLLVLEGILWTHGSAGAHHRDGGTGSFPLVSAFLGFTINP